MTRLFAATALIATLFTSSLLAAETGKTLAPGKPAGVKAAQDLDSTAWWVIGLGAVAVGGVVALTSSEGSGSMPQAQTPVATATST